MERAKNLYRQQPRSSARRLDRADQEAAKYVCNNFRRLRRLLLMSFQVLASTI